MCCSYPAASWSRLALLLGLAAIVLQALSLFTGSWLHTKEVLTAEGDHIDIPSRYGSVLVHARVGLLRTCIRIEKTNATSYPYTGPHPSCFALPNNLWQDVSSTDLGVRGGNVHSTATVVTNVRQYTLVLGSAALGLMLAGELASLVSHFKPTNKLGVVLGCYLFLFAGLIICLIVVTFSMMADVPRRDPPLRTRPLDPAFPFSWELGTSYYLAVGAFALTHIVAAVLVSAFMKRFASLEAMVREVVPGADRKLREHQENNLVGLWEIYPSRAMRQLGCITLPGAMGCYGKLGSEGQALQSAGERAGKSKPDICSSNPESSADSLQQHLQQHLQADDAHAAEAGQDHQLRPVSPFDTTGAAGRSVTLGQPMSLTTAAGGPSGPQAPAAASVLPSGLPPPPDALAGVSVPITVMRTRPHPGSLQHRTIPCGAVEDATQLDTFPAYAGNADGTMTVARRKPGAGVPGQGGPGANAFSTLDNRSRCGSARMHGHANAHANAHANTHTLPHPPRQF